MKIKCIDNKRYKDLYTIGKVYDFEPEKGMINDLGGNNFRRFKTFEMLNEASGAEWELVENAVSKIKVRCLDNTGNQNMYMQGKIYDLVPGRGIIGDDGRIVYICESFEELQMNSVSKWELVEDEIEEETAEPSAYLLKCTATSDCYGFTQDKEYTFTAGKGLVDDDGAVLVDWCKSVDEALVALADTLELQFELVTEVPSISRAYAELGKKLVENMAAIEAFELEEPAVDYLEKYREALEERDMYKNDFENLREAYELLGKKADAAIVKHANRKNKLEKKCKTLYIKLHGVEKSYKNAVEENTKLHAQVKELKEALDSEQWQTRKALTRMTRFADDMELIKTFVNRIADREE